MGHLFYNELGGVAGTSIVTLHNANYSLFSNVLPGYYWSGTSFPMVRFSLATGLRLRNVTHLEWSNVDLSRRVAWCMPTRRRTESR